MGCHLARPLLSELLRKISLIDVFNRRAIRTVFQRRPGDPALVFVGCDKVTPIISASSCWVRPSMSSALANARAPTLVIDAAVGRPLLRLSHTSHPCLSDQTRLLVAFYRFNATVAGYSDPREQLLVRTGWVDSAPTATVPCPRAQTRARAGTIAHSRSQPKLSDEISDAKSAASKLLDFLLARAERHNPPLKHRCLAGRQARERAARDAALRARRARGR